MVQNKSLIITLLFILGLVSNVFAANINWSLAGTASKGTWNAVEEGVVASINDDDTGTNHAGGRGVSGSGGMNYEDIVTFAESANNITKVEMVSAAEGTNGGITLCEISLYYGGSYNVVHTLPADNTWSSRTDNNTGTWENVTAIKVYWVGAYNSGSCASRIYELRAWGPVNDQDSGIRIYDGAAVRKVAASATLGTEKVRVYSGSEVLGLPLVDPADGSAITCVRIYDGSAVKCLKEYTE